MIHDFFSDAIILANSCPPLSHDDYAWLEETVSKEFKWYLIGLTCWFAEKKQFYTDDLNGQLTRERIAANSRNSVETMKRYICYTNSIHRVQKVLPDLASHILAGKTRLGLKTVIVLAKQSPDDITIIMRRIARERTPILQIIMEQIKRPLIYPRKFADGRSTKSTPKSVKDNPRYDPDAQVAGLTFTIPSWIRTINRVQVSDNLHRVSKSACGSLSNELANLKSVIERTFKFLMEEKK